MPLFLLYGVQLETFVVFYQQYISRLQLHNSLLKFYRDPALL